jgi:hypothetical protein
MAKDRHVSGPDLGDLPPKRRCRSSVVEHFIGNEEVDSSILSGSTSFSKKPPYPRISAGSQVASPGTMISSTANKIMITA